MKNFLQEFKAFALKGNVIDLAVAVIIGTAFARITTSLVNNIVMPLFGALLGGVDFTTQSVLVGDAEITYGVFIQSIIEFVVIAFAIFVAVKLLARLQRKEEQKEEEAPALEPSDEVKLLTEIRDQLTRRG